MSPSAENPDRIFREAAARICASLDVEETMRAIADSAQRALGADRATCYVIGVDDQVVSGAYTTETDARRRAFIDQAVGRGARRLPIWGSLLANEDPVFAIEDSAACSRPTASRAGSPRSSAPSLPAWGASHRSRWPTRGCTRRRCGASRPPRTRPAPTS